MEGSVMGDRYQDVAEAFDRMGMNLTAAEIRELSDDPEFRAAVDVGYQRGRADEAAMQHDAYDAGHTDGVDHERAAVVRDLRARAADLETDGFGDALVCAEVLRRRADAIERGEHRQAES
jgi:hypothetical protein